MGALGENLRLAARVLEHGVRRGGRRIGARAKLSAPGRTSDRLLVAPQDLRTADPTIAAEIYSGAFTFQGRALDAQGASPFAAKSPSPEFAAALNGFGWLRHLKAADTSLAQVNGRALVDEWISLNARADPVAHSARVTARRLVSWLCHSPLILDGADRTFYRRFLRSLGRQTRLLQRKAGASQDGAPRLLARIALAYAGLCLSGEARLLKTATRSLCEELGRQILADGGHVGRNPATLVELLLDLVPLSQAYLARDIPPPPALTNSIDRMLPMLRFFRHGDGDFAQFNGAGPAAGDLLAAILAFDDARGAPVEDAPHSGYQRLSAGEGLVIMDAGPPPPMGLSDEAHAGCLSFELSSGDERIVVNCGSPRFGRRDWEEASRATAAHSTVTIGETSSCRFASDRLRRIVGAAVVAGPEHVPVERSRDAHGVRVSASHDGYAAAFGLIHERALVLSPDGARLAGLDAVRPVGERRVGDPKVALRFHLHPSVRASARQDGQGVVLALPSGVGWSFSAPGFAVSLEESVYLASARGPRRSEQIVVHTTALGAPSVEWSFERLAAEPAQRRRMPAAPTLDPLPL